MPPQQQPVKHLQKYYYYYYYYYHVACCGLLLLFALPTTAGVVGVGVGVAVVGRGDDDEGNDPRRTPLLFPTTTTIQSSSPAETPPGITTRALKEQQQPRFDLDGEAPGDRFGTSVAMSSDGNRIIVGAPRGGYQFHMGHVRVLDWTDDGTDEWVPVGQDLYGDAAGNQFGTSVAMSSDGNRIAVGAPHNDFNGVSSGRVRVFDWNGTDWTRVGPYIDSESGVDYFGSSVAMSSDGSRIVVGATNNDGNNGVDSGHVRVFDWTGGTDWIQVGKDLDGEAADEESGTSVAMSSDGNRFIVGARFNDNGNNEVDSGHVRVFEWTGTDWVQVGKDLDGQGRREGFGTSVAMSSQGDRVAVGAPYIGVDNGVDSGDVRVFDWTGSEWVQVGQDINGEDVYDQFGRSVALSSDGDRIVVGARFNDNANGGSSGHVRVFDWTGTKWVQVGQDLDGEGRLEGFGTSVAMSSDGIRITAGAPRNDGNGADAGRVRVFDWTGTEWVSVGQERDSEATGDGLCWSVSLRVLTIVLALALR